MRCGACGTENRAGRKFCVQCGAPLEVVCPACGARAEPGERFCGECGTQLPTAAEAQREEERRLATILFADLAGFTSMSEGMDPEAVKALASRSAAVMSEEVRKLGGTVTSVMGDAIMGVFGAPVAHEDDPERAVRAARAMQARIGEVKGAPRKLELHIGINTGETMAGVVGPDDRRDYTAMGDTTNTAARLMGSAPTGSIYVGEETYRATREVVTYREVDPIKAKGKAGLVRTWEVLDVAPVPQARTLRTAAPLVGRQAELETLLALWDGVVEDPHPGMGLIIGPPGIGKSRLLTEVRQRLARDAAVHSGRCLPYGEGITYWPVVEILKDASGILHDDDPATDAAKLDTLLSGLATEDPDELRTMSAALATLLGAPTTPRGTYSVAEITQVELDWGLRRLFELLAARAPLVLIVEDLHWAEPTLLHLLQYVVRETDRAPILILGTARPELADTAPDIVGEHERRRVVTLRGLDEAESEALLAELLPAESAGGTRTRFLVQNAGGNPLFLEETVRMLGEAGGDVAVPTSLQSLIGSRLDLLPGGERTVAQHAAVVGTVFWPGAVAHLAQSNGHIASDLEGLEGRDIVRVQSESTIAGEVEYAFKHILLRDVAYGRLPKQRRSELHVRCADWVSALSGTEDEFAEIVAYHLEESCKLARELGPGVVEAPVLLAVEALKRAAEKTLRREGNQEAERFFARALAIVGSDQPETGLELRLHRGRALIQLGHLGEGGEELLQVAGEAADLGRLDLRCGALIELAMIDQVQGRAADCRRRLTEALQLAPEIGDRRLEVRAAIELAEFRADFEGEMDAAIEGLREAVRLAEELGDQALKVEAHLRMASVLENKGDLAAAEEELVRELALARELGSLRDEARATFLLGWATYYRGDREKAECLGRQARDWLERTGEKYLYVQNLVRVLAVTALARGDPSLAEEWLQEALPPALEVGGWLVVEVYRYLTEALLQQGRVNDARELASFARQNLPEEDAYAQAQALVARGSVAGAEGDRGTALESFTEALRLMDQQRLVIEAADARVAFARTLRPLGDRVRARDELNQARERFIQAEAHAMVADVDRDLAALLEDEEAGRAGLPSS
jgi:class 3 adenylate cyclase/tetratricopeptide (TPR) repeat protein